MFRTVYSRLRTVEKAPEIDIGATTGQTVSATTLTIAIFHHSSCSEVQGRSNYAIALTLALSLSVCERVIGSILPWDVEIIII